MKYLLLIIFVLWIIKQLFRVINTLLEHSRMTVVPTRDRANVEAWIYDKQGGSEPVYFYVADAHRINGREVLQRVNRYFKDNARVNMVIVANRVYGN